MCVILHIFTRRGYESKENVLEIQNTKRETPSKTHHLMPTLCCALHTHYDM